MTLRPFPVSSRFSCFSVLVLIVLVLGFLGNASASSAANQETLDTSQVSLTANQVYVPGSRNPLQRLDIYAPASTVKPKRAKLPVIVYIHGGSFCLGDKVTSAGAMPQVFANKDFVFVSIDYRLSPAAHFPAHVQDVASAITWVHNSIARYGGDPNKIFLLGHSAGAQLAALVSSDERFLRRHGLGLKTVSGVVLLDGGAFDVTAALLTDKRQPVNSPAFGSNAAIWRQASPVSHVRDGKNIPPFLIYYLPLTLQSTEQNSKLIRALRRARVPVDVHVIANKNHRQINEDLGNPDDPEGAQIVRFFKSRLNGLCQQRF
jgi:arylformamidase